MTVSEAMFSSQNQGWRTPESVLSLVRQVAPIALDPCTEVSNPTLAVAICVPPDASLLAPRSAARMYLDGLRHDWCDLIRDVPGLIFVNPPYGRARGEDAGISPWMERCADAGRRGCSVIALPPARTDTQWWHTHAITADAICYWRGRIEFVGPSSNGAPFPSALPYWGRDVELFRKVFSPWGFVSLR